MIVAIVKARVTGGTDWIKTSGDDRTAIIVRIVVLRCSVSSSRVLPFLVAQI